MKHILLFFLVVVTTALSAQISPSAIQIARDKWGVPHIFAKTDPEVAYGLAWAHAEDDFRHIQENLLAGKGRLAEVLGKDGALFDFALQFFQIDTLVESRYYTDLSDKFRSVVEGYAEGLNAYAREFPKQVLLKHSFPMTGIDVIKGYMLNLTLMAGGGMALKAVHDNLVDEIFKPNEIGSNALAIAPHRTEDGKTWLVANSHQPIEGRFAWYEAHLCSEEGWNMLGGLFPGGVTVFVGSNENLGWAHTNNYHNFGDVYRLEVNPENKNQYKYDGKWLEFGKRVAKLKVKLAGIKLPVKRTVLISEYGPVYKNKAVDYYAVRMPAAMDIRAGEQWYNMNKSKNFNEFEVSLQSMAVPMFNTVYADKKGNIFLFSGGRVPKRDAGLNWSNPIEGNSSAYNWTETLPYSDMPFYFNPEAGYLFNANNSPFRATCADEQCYVYHQGFQIFDYNRGERFSRLMGEISGKFTSDDLHRIKYDKYIDPDGSYMKNFKALYTLDPAKYPDLAEAIAVLKKWDKQGNIENKQASLGMITNYFLGKSTKMPYAYLMIQSAQLSEDLVVSTLRKSRDFMLKRYGTLEVPLGEIQYLVRGDKRLPVGGMSEVPRACDVKLFDKRKGHFKMTNGDGYIQFARFSESGVELRTINAYGASANKDCKHYDDQMDMFVSEETKPMTLDKIKVLQEAERVYSPK